MPRVGWIVAVLTAPTVAVPAAGQEGRVVEITVESGALANRLGDPQ